MFIAMDPPKHDVQRKAVVLAEPVRLRNNFVRGYSELMVRIPG
ncbi:MAG: hypothetical protein ACOYLX_07315 [Burkholderiaceae bacterium]